MYRRRRTSHSSEAFAEELLLGSIQNQGINHSHSANLIFNRLKQLVNFTFNCIFSSLINLLSAMSASPQNSAKSSTNNSFLSPDKPLLIGVVFISLWGAIMT
ncbi:MAG: hypothetical protein MHPSP_002827, partial [Paramarteilia canceri]